MHSQGAGRLFNERRREQEQKLARKLFSPFIPAFFDVPQLRNENLSAKLHLLVHENTVSRRGTRPMNLRNDHRARRERDKHLKVANLTAKQRMLRLTPYALKKKSFKCAKLQAYHLKS